MSVPSVCQLQSQINELRYGVVVVRSPSGASRSYIASADSGVARMAALAEALASVGDGDVVSLRQGEFTIAEGAPMSSFIPEGTTNVSVICEEGAAHIYADENDAPDDAALFPGTSRNAWHFGVYPDLTTDMQPRIQAALFSMPPTGDVAEDIAAYPNLTTRKGTLYLKSGSYTQLNTIYSTGYQQIICEGGRPAALVQGTGFAPSSGSEKFQIYVVRGVVDGSPAASFLFDTRFINLLFINQIALNTKGSAILFAGAQGSKVAISISGMGSRGFVTHGGCAYFDIERIWAVGEATQTGPMVEIGLCQGFSVNDLQLEGLNNDSGDRLDYTEDSYTFNLPGLLIYQCHSFNISVVNGEQIGTIARIQNSRDFVIGPINGMGSSASGMGEVMVSLRGAINYQIGGMEGAYFTKLYEVQDDSGTVIDQFVSSNASFAATPGINHSLRDVSKVSAPTLTLYKHGASALAKTWSWQAGGSTTNSLGVFFSTSTTDVIYNHILTQSVSGNAGEFPPGFTISLDFPAGGGVSVGKLFNVGWGDGAAAPEIRTGNVKVLGLRGAAVADASGGAVVDAEARTAINTLLARLRAHGIIAT